MSMEEILEALKALIEAAEGRDLTDEEAERYEQLEADLAVARRSVEIRSRQAAYETPVGDTRNIAGQVATTDTSTELDRAFDHYLRTGQQNQDIVELRAQSEGLGSEGGYLVPDGFRDKLQERMLAFGGLATVVETVTTSTGNPLPWPTLDDTANVGEIVAEGGTFSAGADLVFGQKSLGAYKYMAGGGSATPLRVSVELLQDSAFDVQSLVTRKLGERIARIQSRHWVTGTGVGEPQGIVDGITGEEASASGPTYDDLVDWTHNVDPAYREAGQCRWAFNDASLAAVQKIKDSHGDPIWRPLTADMGTALGNGTLLGYPVTIDQGFGNYVATGGADDNWGVFGDLQAGYVIRRVRDVVLVVNPWTRAANGQVEYTAWARADGAQQDINAYVVLAGHTT